MKPHVYDQPLITGCDVPYALTDAAPLRSGLIRAVVFVVLLLGAVAFNMGAAMLTGLVVGWLR